MLKQHGFQILVLSPIFLLFISPNFFSPLVLFCSLFSLILSPSSSPSPPPHFVYLFSSFSAMGEEQIENERSVSGVGGSVSCSGVPVVPLTPVISSGSIAPVVSASRVRANQRRRRTPAQVQADRERNTNARRAARQCEDSERANAIRASNTEARRTAREREDSERTNAVRASDREARQTARDSARISNPALTRFTVPGALLEGNAVPLH
jgi:hypothetical protein